MTRFPSVSLPVHLSLESDRKRAKALLKRCRARDAEAIAAFAENHPRFQAAKADTIVEQAKLADAQFLVARQYSFRSWPAWKQYVETRALDRAAQGEALVTAACSNDVRKANVLLEADPGLATLNLMTACVCGEAEAVRRQLERDPEAVHRKAGPEGWEPLLYACFSRLIPTRPGDYEVVVKYLLEAGGDPNTASPHEWEGRDYPHTVLFGAAGIANHEGLTRMLLDAGADPDDGCGDPDASDGNAVLGIESLYHASEFADAACLRLLLAAGPHPKRVSFCLGRALDFADCGDRVSAYLEHGADPNFRVDLPYFNGECTLFHKAVKLNRDAQIIRLLLEAGGDPCAIDSQGQAPVQDAARFDNSEVVDLLREHGADVSGLGGVELDAQMMCWAAARDDAVNLERCLTAGLDVNTVIAEQDGPVLHWAVWRGRLNTTELLLERGADINQVNGYGGDALETTIHGSAFCQDPDAGMTAGVPEADSDRPYAEVAERLIALGAKLPAHIWGGSDAVQDVLRRHGVPEAPGG